MIDKIDTKLLFELNWDARQTHSGLAKKLKVSKQVIRYRMQNLEKSGIIQSYHALIDWRKLGYNVIRVYVKWHNIPPEKEQEIYARIKKDPLFMWTVKFEGEFDIGFFVWVKSIPQFSEKWLAFLIEYKRYILKYEIYEAINMVHYPMKTLIEDKKYHEKILGEEKLIKYDHIDYEILKLVTENSRIPIINIAKKIKLTAKAAIYRLKRLEKNKIIIGYNALIDTNKIGYTFCKIDFYLNDLSRIKEMFEYAKIHKNVVYRMETIGGPELEIEVMIKDNAEIKILIENIRKKFAGIIETYRIHRFDYTIKQIYLPGEEIKK